MESASLANARELSGSPPTQPALTKRDVRRNRIMEKLQGMINTFTTNNHHHYRAQLQGVQVDMTLVLRADPYAAQAPLADDRADIHALIEAVMQGDGGATAAMTLPSDEAARNDYWSLAGKRYAEFVGEANDAMAQRDADLTMLHKNYENALTELERIHQQRLHQAEEEHKALSATIRQRLITSLTKKRQQLLRDKEQLDITDSNAFLLHPNHFSIGNNPGSPSHHASAINKRTRHLRHHRGASPGPAADGNDNGKRKRKLAQLDDDPAGNESPLAGLMAGSRSPYKDTRAQREFAQFEAPAYSIERIFTDKELAMATETAKIATYKFFHQPQQLADSTPNGTAVPSVDDDTNPALPPESGDLPDEPPADPTPHSPPPSAAPEMERTTSQVLTRGGARANPLAALSDLAAAAAAQSHPSSSTAVPLLRENPFTPIIPPYHAVSRSEKSGAPPPPPVPTLDIESDFEMMRHAAADDPSLLPLDPSPHPSTLSPPPQSSLLHPSSSLSAAAAAPSSASMRRHLLDQALGLTTLIAPYRLPPLEPGPAALIGRGVDRDARTGFAPLPFVPVASAESSRRLLPLPAASANHQSSMAAALTGRFAALPGSPAMLAEPMSRTTSLGGASERGGAEEDGGVGVALPTGRGGRRGRGKLV